MSALSLACFWVMPLLRSMQWSKHWESSFGGACGAMQSCIMCLPACMHACGAVSLQFQGFLSPYVGGLTC